MTDFLKYCRKIISNSTVVVFTLLILNILSGLIPKPFEDTVRLFSEMLPTFIQEHLAHSAIEPYMVFQAFNVFLSAQSALLIYWLLSIIAEKVTPSSWNIKFLPLGVSAKNALESILKVNVILILSGNLVSQLGIVKLGICDYFNYICNNFNLFNLFSAILYLTNILPFFYYLFALFIEEKEQQ